MSPAFEELTNQFRQEATDAGIEIFGFGEFEKMGDRPDIAKMPDQPPSADDLSTICYTSGTTGKQF